MKIKYVLNEFYVDGHVMRKEYKKRAWALKRAMRQYVSNDEVESACIDYEVWIDGVAVDVIRICEII